MLIRYSRNTGFTDDPFASPGNQTIFPGYSQLNDPGRQNAVVSHTFDITPNLLNETRVGYTWFSSNIRVQSPDTNNAAALGVTQLHPAAYLPQYAGAPTINVTGVGQFVDVSMLGVMSALVACEPLRAQNVI